MSGEAKAHHGYVCVHPRRFGVVPISEHDFAEALQAFTFHTCLSKVEAIRALQKTRGQCVDTVHTQLFATEISKTMKLEEFESMQSQFAMQQARILKDKYVPACCCCY